MNVLVFDTATDVMHIALGNESAMLDSRTVKSTAQNYNSAFLISTIADVLSKNSLKMADINAIGVNIGPGSFTGLRASVTVARVIAQQLGIPGVGIPSMQIYSMLNTTDKNTFCIMDARRNMAFVGVYAKNAEPIIEPCIMDVEQALNMAKEQDYFIISDSRMAKKVENCINFEDSEVNFGEFLLKLTNFSLVTGKEYNWAELKPLYIQTPPIHGLP